MARPRGSKDSYKRTRNQWGLDRKTQKLIRSMKESGKTKKEICEETGESLGAVSKFLKTLRKDFYFSEKPQEIEGFKQICGIYVLGFFKAEEKSLFYIGSSSHIAIRVSNHPCIKTMEQKGYTCKAYLLEECEESELLHKEKLWIDKYCPGSLLNQQPIRTEEVKSFFDKALENGWGDSDKYTVDENGCWNWNRLKRGYGRPISVQIEGALKFITPHRLHFYKTNGFIPTLTRHLCCNKACVNPEHLQEGSYSQNRLDVKKESVRRTVAANSRGPKREIILGKEIGKWKCVDEWVKVNSHKWQCLKCGYIRQTSKDAIKKSQRCRNCRLS